MDCIFCKIANGEVPGEFLYRDAKVFAVKDINPQAPIHYLVMPIEHIPSVADLAPERLPIVAELMRVANHLAEKEGISKRGYRLVINCRREGGQAVPHLHMHLLGGRALLGKLG
ncbi:MAG: histidine triad nucleotide-binding protein [Chloroflexi bacterium]|nr:histidine triad nucleotide-binding protein [Chloroflexota bacterium]